MLSALIVEQVIQADYLFHCISQSLDR